MKDILEQIVRDKRREIDAAMAARPLEALKEEAAGISRTGRSMRSALAASDTGIIAEFKRKSPSRGWIHRDAVPEDVIPAYAGAGASALSILTDGPYFGGSPDFIGRVRSLVDIPILRKDFIIDEYQLYEAKVIGADAVLLIAACLSREKCRMLEDTAHSLGLEVLLEIHGTEETGHIGPDTDMVGVNNRNLGTFVTDVNNSFAMAGVLDDCGVEVRVAESGISSPDTVRSLKDKGFRGFLMGENFMKEADPAKALRTFIAAL